MEAALWGRFETAQYLSQQSIDLGARDSNGMQAVDLAADTQRNTEERTERSRKHYRESPGAGREREQIQALLKRLTSSVVERAETEIAPKRRAFFDRKHNGKLEVYRPQLLELPTGPRGLQSQKAFATLDRGPNYPYVNAMSGYSHTGWPNVLAIQYGQTKRKTCAHCSTYQRTSRRQPMLSLNCSHTSLITTRFICLKTKTSVKS